MTITAKRRGLALILLALVIGLLGFVNAGPAGADGNINIEEIPGLGYPGFQGRCVDFVSGATGMYGDGAGDVVGLNVPAEPVIAILEWSGHDDDTPPGAGDSSLTLEVTNGPAGPQVPISVDGILLPGEPGAALVPPPDGMFIHTWIANVTDLLDGPGTYDINLRDYPAPPWFANLPASWGATITVVYETGAPCEASDIVWRGGADVFFGGQDPDEEMLWGDGLASEGHATELFIFPVRPSASERVVTVQFSSGGVKSVPDACREVALWYSAGSGAPPDANAADLVDFVTWGQPFGVAATGGVEIVKNPFANPAFAASGGCVPAVNPTDSDMEAGHPCPDGPVATCPYRAVALRPGGGGFVGEEWALVQIDVIVPPGAEWLAFQLESPTDGLANNGITSESGGWGGQVLLTVPSPRSGDITISKVVSGDTAGYDPATTFGITLDCAEDAFDQTLELAGSETATVTALPVGTTCSVSETFVPPPLPGFTYGPPVITPSSFTVDAEGQAIAVTVDNPISRQSGGLTIRKRVEGIDGYVPRSVFDFTLDCDDDAFDRTFSLANEEVFTVEGVPVGTVCDITEIALPDPALGFVWGPPFSATVTITDGTQPLEVAAVNVSIAAQSLVLEVLKVVSGDQSGVAPGATFGITVDCSADELDTVFDLAAGEVGRVVGIPLNTSCTVTETRVPEPVAGFRYEDPFYDPGQTVTFDSELLSELQDGGVAGIVVVNPVNPLGPPIVRTGAESKSLGLLGGIFMTVGLLLVLVARRPWATA